MFSTGEDYLSQSGMFIASGTGTQDLSQLGMGADLSGSPDEQTYINTYNGSIFDGRGTPAFSASGLFVGVGATDGVFLPEIDAMSPSQTAVLNITGAITSDPNIQGSLLSGVDKPHILPFLKLGSSSKFEIKNASPFIYKVVSMKEEAINEYLVSATKYETGKFKLIEDNESIEHLANTYSYQTAQTINGITYETLDTPVLTGIQTGVPHIASQTFQITGTWGEVSNVTGYNVILTYPNGEVIDATSDAYTGYSFTGLNQVGVYSFSVNALGNKAHSLTNGYFDSQYNSTGIFVVYDELLTYSTNFIDRIQILNY